VAVWQRLPAARISAASGASYFLAEARNRLGRGAYQRAEVRINKFYGRRRANVTLYAEVVNLLNRRNHRFDRFNGYNARTGQAFLTLDRMFPILPSAGLVVEFGSQ
jgi:hypothetical protein